ncbi:MAG: monoheme cytochrome C [Flavobacteriaceae bacterium]
MEDYSKFKQQARAIYRMMLLVLFFMIITAAGVLYLVYNPDLGSFRSTAPDSEYVEVEAPEEDDFDKIVDGIHQRTGLVDAEGLMAVVNNCTNCHSAQLVTQNRMNRERWFTTIKWMQETQNLWDLGKNEEIIVNYLVTNYPVEKKGRRANLKDIQWYDYQE